MNAPTGITKIDNDKMMAWGWASVASADGSPVTDLQGDVLDIESLEASVIEYVIASRDADVMHQRTGIGKLIESVVLTEEKMEAMGLRGTRVGWWCGFKVTDPAVWKRVRSGELRMFSIVGEGTRGPIDE